MNDGNLVRHAVATEDGHQIGGKWADTFGFTDDETRLEAARAYRDAAACDGWDMKPMYGTEPQCRAAKLIRDGFVMQVLARTDMGKHKFQATVHIWGPDRLAITVPDQYDFAQILSAVSKCLRCGAEGVDVYRAGFAGRYCGECVPGEKRAQEFPGWTS